MVWVILLKGSGSTTLLFAAFGGGGFNSFLFLVSFLYFLQLLEIDALQISHCLLAEISNLILIKEFAVLQQMVLLSDFFWIRVLDGGHSLLTHALDASGRLDVRAEILEWVIWVIRDDDILQLCVLQAIL